MSRTCVNVRYNKKKHVTQIKTLAQTLNLRMILEKLKRVTEFSQKAWLKPYIDMNTEIKVNAKNEY